MENSGINIYGFQIINNLEHYNTLYNYVIIAVYLFTAIEKNVILC